MQDGAMDGMQVAVEREVFYGPLAVIVVLVVCVAAIVFAVKWVGARRLKKSQENS